MFEHVVFVAKHLSSTSFPLTHTQICDDILEHVRGQLQLDSDTVHVTQQQLENIIDAVIAFTKHENVEEMETMLCEKHYIIVYKLSM